MERGFFRVISFCATLTFSMGSNTSCCRRQRPIRRQGANSTNCSSPPPSYDCYQWAGPKVPDITASKPPPYYPQRIEASKLDKMASIGPKSPEVRKAAQEFVSFLNKSVTPFHAVNECKQRLVAEGFVELPEAGAWNIAPGKKYFSTKNRSALCAFAVGEQYKPGNGFSIVVGHTDSPCLRVKPVSKMDRANFNQVGCSIYGGGIWRTWFDRDLSVAGEIVVRDGDKLTRRLIDVRKPVLFIPNLAIHLETDRDSFKCNTEENLRPLLESAASAQLNGNGAQVKEEPGTVKDPRDCTKEHHATFLDMVASAANVNREAIVDLDLYLYDTNPAAVTGFHDEFISGARLDNLVGTYTAVNGLLDSLSDGSLTNETNIRMALCFDNEEVGSSTAQGAGSSITEYILRRLASDQALPHAFEQAIAKSLLISADQAHAWHPNYSAKHEENHRPAFHGGVVVKVNVNQRYATTSTTHAILKQVASEAKVPLQKMIVRNDSPCGSTVGPILATRLGLQTVDVGCPQLAMHSIREFADTSSILQATQLYSLTLSRRSIAVFPRLCRHLIEQLVMM